MLIDTISGIGGFPLGRIIEVYGNEMSGKSTLMMQVAKQCQDGGGRVLWIDYENSFDKTYALSIGLSLDREKFIIAQPKTLEEGAEISNAFIEKSAARLIVWDSLASALPQAELEDDMGHAPIGLQSRLITSILKQLTAKINKTQTCMVFINQIRMLIGGAPGWGAPKETTPGGKALKFYTSQRYCLKITSKIKGMRINPLTRKEEEQVIGNRVRVQCVKNKLSAPFRQVEVDVIFGLGIDDLGSIISLGVEAGLIGKAGAIYTWEEQKYKGEEKLKEMFKNNPTEIGKLKDLVFKRVDEAKAETTDNIIEKLYTKVEDESVEEEPVE
jgi:recombination protein RecA